jgi:hypothetical protein
VSRLAGQGIRVGIIGTGFMAAHINAAVLRPPSTDASAPVEGELEGSLITERRR